MKNRFWMMILVVTTVMLGVSVAGKADVTGLFEIDLSLAPQTNSQESVPFFFDMQTNLQVNVTISGMIFGMDIGFGTTGMEFAIISIGTNLGALAIKDEFVFAPPFGCGAPTWVGVSATLSDNGDGGIKGQCPGRFVRTIGSLDGSTSNGAIAFVKKRVDLQLDIAGVSFGVLALFEDVDFPDIYGLGVCDATADPECDHEHDHFLNTDLYYVASHDNIVDNQTPSFGFGTILTISGQTVSGITVTGITGICADSMKNNRIKKRKFAGEVNKGCVSEDGPLFAFDIEKLYIEGIEIGGVNFSHRIQFKPLQPVSAAIDMSFSLGGLADVKGSFESSNLLSLIIDSITVSLTAGSFSLLLEDVDANLEFDRTTAHLSLTLNPNQNPAGFASTTIAERGIGVQSQEFELTVTRSGLTIALSTTLTQNGSGLSWDNTTFTLSAKLNVITLSSNVVFDTSGLQVGALNFSVGF